MGKPEKEIESAFVRGQVIKVRRVEGKARTNVQWRKEEEAALAVKEGELIACRGLHKAPEGKL